MAKYAINDVATDLDDPPSFVKANLGKLPESFKAQIREGYPDLKPLKLSQDLSTVFNAAVVIAKSTPRWHLTFTDESQGILEGVATTLILRFKDDFIFRFKEAEDGTVVDGRSKSRVGKGDLGANAARINEFFKALKSKLM